MTFAMIMNICSKLFIFILVILFSSCPHMNQNVAFNKKPIQHISFLELIDLESSLYVYVSPKIHIDEYELTFINVFTNGEGFSHYLRTEFERRLDLTFDKNHQSEIVEPLHKIELSNYNLFYDELKSLVSYNNIEYLLHIKFSSISSAWYPVTLDGESRNYCCVEYEVQVITVNNWEVINQFRVSGMKDLELFNYEGSLKEATNNSIENTINYLKENNISNPVFHK